MSQGIAMQPIQRIDPAFIKELRYVLFDIDDTVTSGGKLPACAYSALWSMERAGLCLIPVTGRPAGWCDMIIRQWPVEAVVGENGAFAFHWQAGHVRMLRHPCAAQDPRALLAPLEEAVLHRFPQTRLAHDQFARVYDAAFDFAEEEPVLPLETAYAIADYCGELGAQAKVSSIHVNAWFGDYNKVSMAELLLHKLHCGSDFGQQCLFFGDSPNDEPMFARFPACGVANVMDFAPRMAYLPRYITALRGGEGFAEAADILLKKREE